MRKWKGVLAIENEQTGDGRIIADGAITWAPLPLPLKADHYADDVIGNIATIERVDNKIVATGLLDDDTEIGAERVRMLEAGTAPLGNRWGLSIEPDDVSVELLDTAPEQADDVPVAADPPSEGADVVVASASTTNATRGVWARIRRALMAAAGEPLPDDAVVIDEYVSNKFVERVTAMRLRAVATVTTEALVGCYLELDGAADTVEDPAPADAPPADVVVASAPIKPPHRWFTEPEPEAGDERLVPQFDIDTGEYIGDAVPLHIGDDGQVYGHVAPANRCHIGFDGVCITPPSSPSAYSHFHIGYTVCDSGENQPTGPLSAGCDHAAILGLDERAARDWYANMGLAWANVRVTPGVYGPWMTGALRPGVTDELVVALRGGGVSGDWRGAGNGLELIGILAVSVPGFTVQRSLAASAGSVTIARAQSAVQMHNGQLRVITAPVQRAGGVTAAAGHQCDKCGAAGVTEELRLLRAIYQSTRALNSTRREQLAARIRR